MRRKKLFPGLAFLIAALATPLAIWSAPKPPQINAHVYDPDHHDYHEWDSREASAYEQYRKEHPKLKLDVNFSRTSPKQRREYWNWRYAQPTQE